MKKEELKEVLIKIYKERIWNKPVKIGGKDYLYLSARNEFRQIVKQQGGEIQHLIASIILPIDHFMWCGDPQL